MPGAHDFLIRILAGISTYNLHPYNAEAMLVFASFSAQVKRIGSQDCRIAASAIAASGIVVTANNKHFSQIPDVQFEDWSR
jgi:tRNA(fMet)-specific endonuclease VapC